MAQRLAGRSTLEECGIQVRGGGVKTEQRRRVDVDRFEDVQSRVRKISEPFVPPKPNEFDSATRIGIGRATFGT